MESQHEPQVFNLYGAPNVATPPNLPLGTAEVGYQLHAASTQVSDHQIQLKEDVQKLTSQVDVMTNQIGAIFKVLDLLNQFTTEQEQQNLTFKKKLADFSKEGQLFQRYTQHDSLVERVATLDQALKRVDAKVHEVTQDFSAKLSGTEVQFENQARQAQQRCSMLEEKIKMLNYGVNRDRRVSLANRIKSEDGGAEETEPVEESEQEEDEQEPEEVEEKRHSRNVTMPKIEANAAVGMLEIVP